MVSSERRCAAGAPPVDPAQARIADVTFPAKSAQSASAQSRLSVSVRHSPCLLRAAAAGLCAGTRRRASCQKAGALAGVPIDVQIFDRVFHLCEIVAVERLEGFAVPMPARRLGAGYHPDDPERIEVREEQVLQPLSSYGWQCGPSATPPRSACRGTASFRRRASGFHGARGARRRSDTSRRAFSSRNKDAGLGVGACAPNILENAAAVFGDPQAPILRIPWAVGSWSAVREGL